MDIPMVGKDFAYTWIGAYNFEPDELPATVIVLQSTDLDRTWYAYNVEVLAHA